MMKEMQYKPISEKEILDFGTYKGFDFKVVSYGTHPCCYVAIRKDLPMYKKEYDDDIFNGVECHGGLTFSDLRDFGDGLEWYIGWDYAHLGDYQGIYEHPQLQELRENHTEDKKWTTQEMRLQCIYVIEQLLEKI